MKVEYCYIFTSLKNIAIVDGLYGGLIALIQYAFGRNK